MMLLKSMGGVFSQHQAWWGLLVCISFGLPVIWPDAAEQHRGLSYYVGAVLGIQFASLSLAAVSALMWRLLKRPLNSTQFMSTATAALCLVGTSRAIMSSSWGREQVAGFGESAEGVLRVGPGSKALDVLDSKELVDLYRKHYSPVGLTDDDVVLRVASEYAGQYPRICGTAAILHAKRAQTIDQSMENEEAIKRRIEKTKGEILITGWRFGAVENQTCLVGFLVKHEGVEKGFFFEVNTQLGIVRPVWNDRVLRTKYGVK